MLAAFGTIKDNTLNDYIEFYDQYVSLFTSCIMDCRNGEVSVQEIFNIAEVSVIPKQVELLLEDIITTYQSSVDQLDMFTMLTILNHINNSLKDGEKLVDITPPDYFISGGKLLLQNSYYLLAVVQCNEIIPLLASNNIQSIGAETFIAMQRNIEKGHAALNEQNLLQQYKGYISPDNLELIIKQKTQNNIAKISSNGGKARAAKLYGNTKAYVAKRFTGIRSKNKTISMAQIAQKIAYELEENPIEGDESLSNPYDTIYRWVRAMNKRKVVS